MTRAALALCLCLPWALAPAAARAEPADQARARELFELGVAAAERSDFAAAVEAFDQSHALFAHPGTLANLAQCHDARGQRVAAYRSWRELIERFGTVITERALDQARQRVAALEAELAAVRVFVSPAGASLQVDAGEPRPTPVEDPLRLEPGAHEFVGRRDGFRDEGVTRTLRPGVNPDVTLTLSPVVEVALAPVVGAPPTPADGAPNVDRRRRGRGFWRGPWPWVVGAVLAAGALGLGLGLGLADEAPDQTVRFP